MTATVRIPARLLPAAGGRAGPGCAGAQPAGARRSGVIPPIAIEAIQGGRADRTVPLARPADHASRSAPIRARAPADACGPAADATGRRRWTQTWPGGAATPPPAWPARRRSPEGDTVADVTCRAPRSGELASRPRRPCRDGRCRAIPANPGRATPPYRRRCSRPTTTAGLVTAAPARPRGGLQPPHSRHPPGRSGRRRSDAPRRPRAPRDPEAEREALNDYLSGLARGTRRPGARSSSPDRHLRRDTHDRVRRASQYRGPAVQLAVEPVRWRTRPRSSTRSPCRRTGCSSPCRTSSTGPTPIGWRPSRRPSSAWPRARARVYDLGEPNKVIIDLDGGYLLVSAISAGSRWGCWRRAPRTSATSPTRWPCSPTAPARSSRRSSSRSSRSPSATEPVREDDTTDRRSTVDPARVPPYLLTGGRARPVDESLAVEAQVLTTLAGGPTPTLQFEVRDIVDLCDEATRRGRGRQRIAPAPGRGPGPRRRSGRQRSPDGPARPPIDPSRRVEIIERVIRGLDQLD